MDEFRACSIAHGSGALPSEVKARIEQAVGGSQRPNGSALNESEKREERRHQEAVRRQQGRRRPAKAPRSVLAVTETQDEHTLAGYRSAGVDDAERALTPWTGSCSCGNWRQTVGSKVALLALWRVHVSESIDEPRSRAEA